MKLAYVTGDILPNKNFAFFHDLLANYPVPEGSWQHKVLLISPMWDRGLTNRLKERFISVEACFEEFQKSTDLYWRKIKDYTSDCDVIISGNITNLDEVLHDGIDRRIVSVSLAEKGYKSPLGGYGSFYKPRFDKVAISKTAVEAFPEHVRKDVQVIYPGIDPSRVSQRINREQVRENWFFSRADAMKVALFVGNQGDEKGLPKLIAALDYLPKEWHVLALGNAFTAKIPDHLRTRIHLCRSTFDIADIYLACDCFVLPTQHEGFSTSLMEAWFLAVPTVTTRHKAMLEMMGKHPEVDFGSMVDVDVSPEELAKTIQEARASTSATECMYRHYMASNMVDSWRDYLER